MATFQKITVVAPYALTLPTIGDLLKGDPNPFYPLVLFMNDAVANQKRFTNDGVMYTWNAEVILEMFSVGLATLITGNGGDILSLPFFFVIDLTAQAPDRLKQSNDQGQLIAMTWQEFFDSTTTSAATIIRGVAYIGTNVFTGNYLPASEALAMGVTLKTLPEIQALQAAEPDVDP